MTSPTLTPWAASWHPPDPRGVAEWAAQYVSVPGSARALNFDPTASPWLKEPLDYFGDNRVREMVCLFPTGAGKTTIFDVTIPHAIVENPGSILLAMQTDPDAKEHMEDRLMPTLAACEPLQPILAQLSRHAMRKDAIIFPHMSLYVGGANKTNFQRKSVRYVFLDEAWLIKHGLIGEARARTHNRWNRRVVIVSQGGDQHTMLIKDRVETELYAAWRQTDCREYSMPCPECGEVSPWKLSNLKYEDAETADGEIDQTAVIESARYECPACKTRFEDLPDIRRRLANGSVYVSTNPNPLPAHHGWHAPALALFHERWGDLALGWKKASIAFARGDIEPRKTFITKRLAEFWKDVEDSPDVVLGGSDYFKSDFANGELWDGELHRFLTIDRQRDHFWCVARAWKHDGSSRLLWEGKILTSETIRELQKTLKIIDDYTFQDAQHDTGDVYDDCAKYSWVALHGSGEDGFMHHPKNSKPVKKFFSPLKYAMAPHGGRARYIFWANTGVKDILTQLRGGRGPQWQAPDDVSREYRAHIISEMKKDHVSSKTKQVTQIYQRIAGRPNHLWDCESMQVTAALIKGVLGGHEVETADTEATA